MPLVVWVVEPDAATAAQLSAAWKTVAGSSVTLRLFSAPPSGLLAPAPDLLMAEIAHCCNDVTHLLLLLRQMGSTDFLPITTDTSPASFTRAQQLGAIDYILKPFTSRRLLKSLRRYLALKRGLSAGRSLTQGQLDLFFFSGVSRKQLPALALPQADVAVCTRLLAFLARCPRHGCSALEAGQALAVSRVTARRYLELLAEAGYVVKSSVPGQVGRPSYFYQLKGEFY